MHITSPMVDWIYISSDRYMMKDVAKYTILRVKRKRTSSTPETILLENNDDHFNKVARGNANRRVFTKIATFQSDTSNFTTDEFRCQIEILIRNSKNPDKNDGFQKKENFELKGDVVCFKSQEITDISSEFGCQFRKQFNVFELERDIANHIDVDRPKNVSSSNVPLQKKQSDVDIACTDLNFSGVDYFDKSLDSISLEVSNTTISTNSPDIDIEDSSIDYIYDVYYMDDSAEFKNIDSNSLLNMGLCNESVLSDTALEELLRQEYIETENTIFRNSESHAKRREEDDSSEDIGYSPEYSNGWTSSTSFCDSDCSSSVFSIDWNDEDSDRE